MESTDQDIDIQPQAPVEEKKKQQRPSKYTWDRTSITLETKLIELPKKTARLVKPEFDAMEKKLKEVEDKIKATIERKKKIIEELILKSKENFEQGNSKSQPLREQFNEKKEVKTSLQKEFDDAKNAHNEIKEKIAKLTEKQNELKLKMKGKFDPKQLEDRLDEVIHSLENDVLSGPEEKKLVKEREELEAALPFAVPIKNISIQLDELNKQRKEVKPRLDAAYEKYNAVRQELTGLAGGLDEIRAARTSDKEKTDPLFGDIRKEYDDKIEALKQSKKTIRDEFRVARDKYEEEQDDIRYYDWAKRIQDNLRKDKQRQDREERAEAEEAAAEKQKIESLENPNKVLIDGCDMALKYCQMLIRAENKPAQEEVEEKAPEREINLAELKKEKLEVMAPKKEVQKFAVNNKKNNKQPAKKQQASTESVRQMLNLPLDIINALESVNVRAPIFINDVQAAIDAVSKKQEELQVQGEKELAQKKESLLNGTTSLSGAAQETGAAKKVSKVYHEKETDFPTL